MDEEALNPLTSEEGNNGDQPMPDLPDQDLSSSDSDSDSDSDSGSEDGDDQAHQNLQLQTLEAELSANPGNYDTHVQYIKILRQMADIEKLRQAREAMNQLFPLTPSMWQDWAKDEASLSTGSDAFWAIEKLYERGVFEYLSISLWRDYLDFVKENDPSVRECSPAGISKARDLFERALTAAGLHVSEGNKLWEAYRSFEQAIFHTIDEKDNQAREKQIQRVRSLFHRQLSVPHVNMRSTLLDYKAWEVERGNILDAGSSDLDGISFQVASAYKKALEMYDGRDHLEEQICLQDMSDSERLQNFMNYLRFEQSSGDPARVQTLYERAITAFPISSYLWLDYTRYLDKTLKVGNVITNVYSRAVMNCPCVGELWVQYMLSLERGHASEKEIASVFEKSLLCTLTLDEYLDLYLTRVDGLRRRISCAVEAEHGLEYSLIRETFQNASDYLSAYLKNTDGLLRLHAYWARLELNLHKDQLAARGVWETLLKLCNLLCQLRVNLSVLVHKSEVIIHVSIPFFCIKWLTSLYFVSHPGLESSGFIFSFELVKGLAYVDFSDDAHLVAAVAKNKQMLLGKKLSIARSDPKHGKKEHARGAESNDSAEASNAPRARQGQQSTYNRGSDNVQLKGRNTFATPRNILALGRSTNKPTTEKQDDEKPKSNDEFRNMFLKG
ncbi:hypothetical protein C1H46_037401 [Malus baccata]|uniref:Uncharacterized protein n=1 Tax=Malus baccata TaxID=106549 RepID=A0A540KS68_MALBA|nr:hypothetical protein C1H46_037401 [Malus baccata]